MLPLAELFRRAGVEPDRISGNVAVGRLSDDSRRAGTGQLFVCMPSASGDSHRFLADAAARGVSAALTHSDAGFDAALGIGLGAALVRDESGKFTEALWRLAKIAFDDPSARLRVVGVTGTNGKSTTAWVIRDALEARGKKAAYLGTLGYRSPAGDLELNNTTPFAVEMNALLAKAVDDGMQDFVMEVSSHALEQRRTDGIEFDAAVFTNLTQDHLDFHGTMEFYEAAKLRLFTDYPARSEKRFVGALNIDDPVGARWAQSLGVPMVTFGLAGGDLHGEPIDVGLSGIRMNLSFAGGKESLETRLGGQFNVQNCLSACAGLLALGYSLGEAVEGLSHAVPVPGRFESVPNERGFGVIVDYAHTPDALDKLLGAARALNPVRLIAVFGCGGDRDRSKRPKMADVVSSLADLTVLTSDNPRTEDAEAILDDVAAGLRPGAESVRIADRREAIANAVRSAQPGDVVVIAGKGHENYQIVGRTKHAMDDRELAREALASLGAPA